MGKTIQFLKKGDYVCSLRDQSEIGVVDRVKRTRVPHSTDMVVSWLTHAGSSHEFSSGLKRLDPTDPQVVALTTPAKSKAGRPAKWNGPTRAIRVPEHLAEHLLDIARELDNPQPDNVQNPSGLPICKPAADAATIAQGLEEGWIVRSKPLPPYLLTSDSPKGTYTYIVDPPPDIPAAVWAEADRLLDEVCGPLSQKERWLMLGRLVEEWGKKVDA